MTPESKLAQQVGGLKSQARQDREEWRARLGLVERKISRYNTILWCIGINLIIVESIIVWCAYGRPIIALLSGVLDGN